MRELNRQISSGAFERAMLAEGKLSDAIKNLPQETEAIFRDSYLLDFLDLPAGHSEKDLQKAIMTSINCWTRAI